MSAAEGVLRLLNALFLKVSFMSWKFWKKKEPPPVPQAPALPDLSTLDATDKSILLLGEVRVRNRAGSVENIMALIEGGADMKFHRPDSLYGTLVENAVQFHLNHADNKLEDNLRILDLLKKHGADINAVDHAGWTPLHHAVFQGTYEIVKWFVDNGAILGKRNSDKETPFMMARDFDPSQFYSPPEWHKIAPEHEKIVALLRTAPARRAFESGARKAERQQKRTAKIGVLQKNTVLRGVPNLKIKPPKP